MKVIMTFRRKSKIIIFSDTGKVEIYHSISTCIAGRSSNLECYDYTLTRDSNWLVTEPSGRCGPHARL